MTQATPFRSVDTYQIVLPGLLVLQHLRWLQTPKYLPSTPAKMGSLKITYKVPPILQPRLTWRYCLASVTVLYVSYCVLFGKPFFSSKLPPYTGPHGVGIIDIEVPVREPRLIDDVVFKDTNKPAFKLDTVLFTLYYPAAKNARSKVAQHYWVPPPLWITAVGYAKFAHVSNWLTNNIFTGAMGILVGSTRIQAQVDVPLVSPETYIHQVNSHHSSHSSNHSGELKKRLEKTLESEITDFSLAIIIFTHGMASTRTQYSHYLGELASRGYICAAIEHRDGSGPGTQIIDSSNSSQGPITRLHFGLNDVKASPSSPNPAHQVTTEEFKAMQLAFREAEILETTHLVQTLNTAEGAQKLLTINSRNEGHTSFSKNSPTWSNRLDLNTTLLVGHSYGATGALKALKPATGTQNPFTGAILLDPGKSSGPLNSDIPATTPILLIHSTSWSSSHSLFYGRPHFDTVRDIATHLNSRGGNAWFMTSLGTSHPSVTDAPLIEPTLLRWTTGASIDVVEGVSQYVHVSEELGWFVRTGGRERRGLLGVKANRREYDGGKGGNAGMVERWRRYWQVHVSPIGSSEERPGEGEKVR